jgi:hypothetical protein
LTEGVRVRALLFCNSQASDDGVGVVGEPDSVDAIGRLQLSRGHQASLVVTRNDGAIDRALDAAAFDGKSDVLRDRLSHARRFVNGGVCTAFPAVHLKWLGAEPAYDKFAVTVGRAVEVALLGRSQIVAGDHDTVGMRMVVQVHELWFQECRSHRVVAGCLVGGIPIRHRRARRDVKRFTLGGERPGAGLRRNDPEGLRILSGVAIDLHLGDKLCYRLRIFESPV